MKKGICVQLLLISLLAGCVSTKVPNEALDWSNPAQIKDKAVITKDSFNGQVTIVGPECHAKSCRITSQPNKYGGYILIRSWYNNESKVQHQLYTVLFAPEWLGIDHAYDSKGNKYSVTQIKDDSVSCVYGAGCVIQEAVGINLTESDIVKFSNGGVVLKYYGNGFSSSPWSIPESYFKAISNINQSL
ncbi:MAG: hypothetical protein ACI9U0_002160 [Flavobacteriales bacterium]|jgi:hypothetical protein